MGDFKILILAYLIGYSPIETQQTFEMEGWYKTMDECKTELLKQKPDGRYEVMNEFVVDGQFKWDWLVAGCKVIQLEKSFNFGQVILKVNQKS